MAINIKDSETDRLIRSLAKITGQSITETIRSAVDYKLSSIKETQGLRKSKRQIIQDMIDRFHQKPVVDTRSEDEILGYDEFGIPR